VATPANLPTAAPLPLVAAVPPPAPDVVPSVLGAVLLDPTPVLYLAHPTPAANPTPPVVVDNSKRKAGMLEGNLLLYSQQYHNQMKKASQEDSAGPSSQEQPRCSQSAPSDKSSQSSKKPSTRQPVSGSSKEPNYNSSAGIKYRKYSCCMYFFVSFQCPNLFFLLLQMHPDVLHLSSRSLLGTAAR
jgi:hypothetical protein